MNQFDIVNATELLRNVPDEDITEIVALCAEKKFAKDSIIRLGLDQLRYGFSQFGISAN